MPAHDNHTASSDPISACHPPDITRFAAADPRTPARAGHALDRTIVARPVGGTGHRVGTAHPRDRAGVERLAPRHRARGVPAAPQGCWWDMTAALVNLPPVEPREAAPTPFWAALIDPASQPTSIPGAAYAADLRTAGAAATTSDRSLNVTGASLRHRSMSPSPTSPPPVKPSTGGSEYSPPSRCAAAESWPFSPAATTNPHQAGRSSTRPASSSPPPKTPTFSTCSTSSSPPAPSSPHARTRRVPAEAAGSRRP